MPTSVNLGTVRRYSERCPRQVKYSTKQAGRHCYHGCITKQGDSHARWLLVQAVQHVAGHEDPLGVFFRRLAQRKNRNVAVAASAQAGDHRLAHAGTQRTVSLPASGHEGHQARAVPVVHRPVLPPLAPLASARSSGREIAYQGSELLRRNVAPGGKPPRFG